MSTELLAVISLFVLRLGIPLVVILTLGMLLSGLNNHADTLAQ